MSARLRDGNVNFLEVDSIQSFSFTQAKHTITPSRKRGRGAAVEWILIEVLETSEEVETIIKSGKWTLNYNGKNNDGKYTVYRCNQSKEKL